MKKYLLTAAAICLPLAALASNVAVMAGAASIAASSAVMSASMMHRRMMDEQEVWINRRPCYGYMGGNVLMPRISQAMNTSATIVTTVSTTMMGGC